MKKKKTQFLQYLFDGENIEGANEDFLDKTAPLIGYIVHSFNTLEQQLNSALCDLFFDDSHHLGIMVILKMSYSEKVDLFSRFLIERQTMSKMESPIFENLVESLEKAGRLRNNVIHANWESAYDDGFTCTKIIMKKKRGIQFEYVQFTPEALEKILEFFNEIYKKFDDYEEEREKIYRSL